MAVLCRLGSPLGFSTLLCILLCQALCIELCPAPALLKATYQLMAQLDVQCSPAAAQTGVRQHSRLALTQRVKLVIGCCGSAQEMWCKGSSRGGRSLYVAAPHHLPPLLTRPPQAASQEFAAALPAPSLHTLEGTPTLHQLKCAHCALFACCQDARELLKLASRYCPSLNQDYINKMEQLSQPGGCGWLWSSSCQAV